MAYIASIHDDTYTVEVGANDQQRSIVLDGTTREIDWRQIAPLAADAQGARCSRWTLYAADSRAFL